MTQSMRNISQIGRRGLLGLAITAAAATAPWSSAGAAIGDTSPAEQVFNLPTVLAASVGPAWARQTRLNRVNATPIRLDYVMHQGPAGWQVVDVLTDGAISRVAVQRSDFRNLLMSGGVPALTAELSRKTANVTSSMG